MLTRPRLFSIFRWWPATSWLRCPLHPRISRMAAARFSVQACSRGSPSNQSFCIGFTFTQSLPLPLRPLLGIHNSHRLQSLRPVMVVNTNRGHIDLFAQSLIGDTCSPGNLLSRLSRWIGEQPFLQLLGVQFRRRCTADGMLADGDAWRNMFDRTNGATVIRRGECFHPCSCRAHYHSADERTFVASGTIQSFCGRFDSLDEVRTCSVADLYDLHSLP